MSLECYRMIYAGSVAVPADFLGISILRWPQTTGSSTPTTPPAFPYGFARALSYGGTNNGNSSWAKTNPSDGVYSWSELDTWMLAHCALGHTINYCLSAVPPWCAAAGAFSNVNTGQTINYGAGSIGPVAEASLPKVQTFVTALLNRYNYAAGGVFGTDARRITALQVWNEPDFTRMLKIKCSASSGTPSGTVTDSTTGHTASFSSWDSANKIITTTGPDGVFTKGGAVTSGGGFSGTIKNAFDGLFGSGWAGTMEELAAVSLKIRAAIDAVDPGVLLIGPAFKYYEIGTGEIAAYMAADDGDGGVAEDHLDRQAYQPYGYYSSLIRGFASSLSIEKAITDMLAIAPLPIHLTEFGITGAVIHSEDEDALDTCRAAVIAAVLGVQQVNFYTYDEGFYPETDEARGYLRRVHELVAGKTITALRENLVTRQLRITYDSGAVAYL